MKTIMQVLIFFAFVNSLAAKPARIRAVTFSPDGKLFAACGSDGVDAGRVGVWDAKTWELNYVFRQKEGFAKLAFSPDGKRIALGRFANEALVLDAVTGEMLGELTGHTNSIRGIAFTPDGRQIVTGSYDKTIRIWHAQTYQLLHTLEDAGEKLWDVKFSPDGKLLAVADDHVFRIFDYEKREERFVSERLRSIVLSVSFSPDGSQLAVPSWAGYCRLYDISTRSVQAEFDTNSADEAAFSPDGKFLAIAASNSVYVYSFDEADDETERRIKQLIADFENDDYQIRETATEELTRLGAVAEPFLAAAMESTNPEVRIRTRRIRNHLMSTAASRELELDSRAACACFSTNGKQLVTGDRNGNLILWNVPDWFRTRDLIWEGQSF